MLIYTQAGYNCGSCVPERGCETSLPPATRAILESIQVGLRLLRLFASCVLLIRSACGCLAMLQVVWVDLMRC